jgi:hypothetical protein
VVRAVTEGSAATTGAHAHTAVLNATRSAVLLVERDGRWTLPAVRVSGLWFDTGAVADALEAEFGARAFIQRCLLGDDNVDPAPVRVYVGQVIDEARPVGRWFAVADLPELDPPATVAALRSWMAGVDAVGPWERQDWLGEVERFIGDHIDGRPLEMRQVRTWPRSSVWRVTAPGAALIFKASPAVFSDEVAISRTLAGLFPDAFPAVVAHDGGRGWLLLEQLRGPTLDGCDAPLWHAAVAAFAEVQIRCAGLRDELLRGGCANLGVDRLRSWTAELLARDGPVASGEVVGLTRQEADHLVARAPEFDEAWRDLAAFGVPETLEHGDFRPGHVVIDRGAPRFFDLAEAAVSHPFFSAVTLLDFEPLPDSGSLWTDLRASYLRPWTAAYPDVDVNAAFAAARPLAVLHAALVRWFRLLPAMTPRSKWEFMVSYWLRSLAN